jgi:hypothetical protein
LCTSGAHFQTPQHDQTEHDGRNDVVDAHGVSLRDEGAPVAHTGAAVTLITHMRSLLMLKTLCP